MDNLTTISVSKSVEETREILESILKEKNIKIFDVFEHSELAEEAGLKIPDTEVVVYGNPKVGTLLMQINPQIAYELPLRFLIHSKNGKTEVAYEDIKHIARQYRVKSDVVNKISALQADLAKELQEKATK